MSPPSIVYLGFGPLGTWCLDALLRTEMPVLGVLCRASDRTYDPQKTSSVYTMAEDRGLRLFEQKNPHAPALLAEIDELAPDYVVSIQYDRILKPSFISLAREATLNLHFGPLPRLRGCFPTKWAIIGDETAGVTLHHIDPGIDTGPLIDQELVPLAPDETDRTLYLKLVEAGKKVFARQLENMANRSLPTAEPQDDAEASYHPKRPPFDGLVDWSKDARWVGRFVRAFTFPPHPAARTFFERTELQLRAPIEVLDEGSGAEPGTATLSDGTLSVQCGEGRIAVGQVLLDGRVVAASDLPAEIGVPEGGPFLLRAEPV